MIVQEIEGDFIICILCGKPFDKNEEPVIINSIDISRKLYDGRERSHILYEDLRCHRKCWNVVSSNMALAEEETCQNEEERRGAKR